MKTVEFTVIGIPQSKGSTKPFARHWRDRETGKLKVAAVVTSSNAKLKPWEEDIRAALQLHAKGVFFDGPVSVRLEFHMPRPQSAPKRVVLPTVAPDIDKLARGAMDALTGKLWKDDSQVVALVAVKQYAIDQPKAVYRVAEIVGAKPLDDAALVLPW
jgi:Holliday junction resolvase RusA-like endonuclease